LDWVSRGGSKNGLFLRAAEDPDPIGEMIPVRVADRQLAVPEVDGLTVEGSDMA
jgi:hypothetical protein